MPAARAQVTAGIQAGTLDDARNVITRLAGQMLPLCPAPSTEPTPQSTPPTTPPTTPRTSPQVLPTSTAGAPSGAAGSVLTRGTATPPAAGSGTVGTVITLVPPTSPAAGTAVNPTGATGSAIPLGSGAPLGTGVPLGSGPVVSTLANGSVVTAQNGSSSLAATGTPLSTRAPEPGVTCRVVK